MPDVSPSLRHGSLAPSPLKTLVPSLHRLFSQYRGPTILNMAETPEEKEKREEEERKAKEDEDKKSNFKKVQEARETAEARVKELELEKQKREEADKQKADDELKKKEEFKTLAEQKEKEAADAKAEASTAKAELDKANAKLKEIADQQEKDLEELLKAIPEDKRPPLDSSDSVEKRLAQVRYAHTLLGKDPKPPVGGGFNPEKGGADRKAELLKKGINTLNSDEALELASLTGK